MNGGVPDLGALARLRMEVEDWPSDRIGRAIAEVRPSVEAGDASLATWLTANVLCDVLSERKAAE